MEACLKASNQVNVEESARNPEYKKVQAMKAFRNDECVWRQVAKYGFDSFIIRTRSRGASRGIPAISWGPASGRSLFRLIDRELRSYSF